MNQFLHSRSCLERGRPWQAEHYVGAVRDHALALACLREDVPAVQARGYDDLSAETLARFEGSYAGEFEPVSLRSALAVSVSVLLHEGYRAGLPNVEAVTERLASLT